MSEEKLYVVKNDEGKYWDTGMPPWWDDEAGTAFKIIDRALKWAKKYDGHVVTLIEEPKKVALTKEQAKIIEEAKMHRFPAAHISNNVDDSKYEEKLLMNAYVNGYTVAKDKKYNVKVPHVSLYYWKKPDGGLGIDDLNVATADDDTDDFEFTGSEIEHYGLQDCEKVEVTDDE